MQAHSTRPYLGRSGVSNAQTAFLPKAAIRIRAALSPPLPKTTVFWASELVNFGQAKHMTWCAVIPRVFGQAARIEGLGQGVGTGIGPLGVFCQLPPTDRRANCGCSRQCRCLLIPLNLETAIRRCNPYCCQCCPCVRSFLVGVFWGAVMPFSSKAQEIHNHIVPIGKTDYWIGVARSPAELSGQHQPRKPYAHNISRA